MVPSRDVWRRIICAAGGEVAVTRGTTTAQVKALAGEKGEGMRLCVIPVGYPAREARPKDNFDAGKIHHEVY